MGSEWWYMSIIPAMWEAYVGVSEKLKLKISGCVA
jgi:hypothetical protein